MFRPLLILALLLVTELPATVAAEALPDSVRIRLFGSLAPRELQADVTDGDLLVLSGRQVVLRIRKGSRLSVRVDGSELVAEADGDVARGRSIRLRSDGTGPVTLHVGNDRRSYRGSLLLTSASNSLQIINTVDLEEYVAAVVATEYSLDDLEGTKAMAVVARTYAVRGMGDPRSAWAHDDDEGSQVYRGSGAVTQVARFAAEETRGEILTWHGEPIEAVYSSSSGGHTASNEDVWNSSPVPYLRGRKDPWDREAPHHEWSWSVEREALDRVIENRFDVRPRSIDVRDRSRDGRAARIRIDARRGDDVNVPGGTFRSAVVAAFGVRSLRSTFFNVEKKGDQYVFEGHGYGHGVGLSQWGAHGMSLAGRSYREILEFYYRDISLERRASTGQPLMLAETETKSPVTDVVSEVPVARRDDVASIPVVTARPAASWGDVRSRENRRTRRRVGW